jgi:uncharacterized protein YcaQ
LITLSDLRRLAINRSLFTPTTLKSALERLGFVQADPIRAPARAQDLTLRHRVRNYRAEDLERKYSKLDIEEDFFVTYGFVTRSLQALMHPRSDTNVPADNALPWPAERKKKAQLLMEFIRERGEVHPREVDQHFSHGRVRNYWGGTSNATTQLLDAMHYRGLLRVARRERGIRIYAAHQHGPGPTEPKERNMHVDKLVDVVVELYSPLPGKSLNYFIRRLRFAVPQWAGELSSALARAKQRLSHARLDGVDWYWPAEWEPKKKLKQEMVRLLAPFDPVVRDRDRFELLWGWVYRFEAYTPPAKRKLGYYALPMLWRDQIIGWGNLSVKDSRLIADFGYIKSQPPRERTFKRELEAELDRVNSFLSL